MPGRYKREVYKLSFIAGRTAPLRRSGPKLPKNNLNDVVAERERRNKAIKRESWCQSGRIVNGTPVKRMIQPSKGSPKALQDQLFTAFLQHNTAVVTRNGAASRRVLVPDKVRALIKLVGSSLTGAVRFVC